MACTANIQLLNFENMLNTQRPPCLNCVPNCLSFLLWLSTTSQLVRRCVINLRSFGNEASVYSFSLCSMSLNCLGNFRTDNLSSYSVLFVISKSILHFKTIHSNSIRLTLRCWGNSSIPEGRFSKLF